MFGWLLARGRCRACRTAIDGFYPLVEVTAALLAIWGLWVVPGWLGWLTCLLGWVLLALALIDLRTYTLPDVLTLALLAAGLGTIAIVDPDRLADHLLGALAGYGVIAALRAAYRWLRGIEGIGLGDAKLLAAAGAWLSWEGLPAVLLVAAACGLLVSVGLSLLRGRPVAGTARLPFGPFLAGAFWLAWLYGPLAVG